MFLNAFIMKFRSVAFVPFKAVERILLGKPFHKTVSASFCDKRSKGNNRLCLISTNDGFLKKKFFWSMEKPVKPHFAVGRFGGKAREDRPDAEPHRRVDAIAVDVRRPDKGGTEPQASSSHQELRLFVPRFTLLLRTLLGVFHAGDQPEIKRGGHQIGRASCRGRG